MSSAVILVIDSSLIDLEMESMEIMFSSEVDEASIIPINSFPIDPVSRVDFSYVSSLDVISFLISNGVFALDISSLNDSDDENFFIIL